MQWDAPYPRIDSRASDAIAEAQRPALHIRWGVPPLALLLCGGQACLDLVLQNRPVSIYLIASQISVISFAVLALLIWGVNPLLRATRVIQPLNRAELLVLFAAMSVAAGISAFGLTNALVPVMIAPHNPFWNIPQRNWAETVIPHLRPELFITDPAVIVQFRAGFGDAPDVLSRIPWSIWVKPFALWMIFILAVFAMFYALSMLAYSSWAHREKIVFPLARLPSMLIPGEPGEPDAAPVWRRPSFWLAFGLVMALFSYNASCQAGWLRDLDPLALGMDAAALKSMLKGSFLDGIAEIWVAYNLRIVIIFTAIGLSFLLPLHVSFSLWVHWLAALGLMVLGIRLAFGGSALSFPSDEYGFNNFISAMGGGALLTFAGICLAKLIHERWLLAAECWSGGGSVSRRAWAAFGFTGVLFALSMSVALGWLCWSGVGILWAGMFLAVVVLITLGLMRVVAESGVYWLGLHAGPFHLAGMAGGTSGFPGGAMASLLPTYSTLFMQVKGFVAPAVLTSFKFQEESRSPSRRFHLTVIAAVLVTLVVSLFVMVWLGYVHGAQQVQAHMFSAIPQRLMDHARWLATGATGGGNTKMLLFYGIGAAWVAVCIVMRGRFFWWLHPIGMVMLVNPWMASLWFSFFVGWVCKKVTVRYGGRHAFDKAVPFFLGLMLGEIAACFIWSLLAVWLGLDRVSIDLNRHRA